MTDDSSLWLIITLTAIGFFALAAILLIPVYRFLLREEEASKDWVESDAAGTEREFRSDNGTSLEDDDRL